MEQPETDQPARIGVILVHGIGEQRRFEHLDGQGREIIQAIRAQKHLDVTVEIASAAASPFHADQDSWDNGPAAPVRAIVRERGGGITHHIHFHEVWWADINERYSLAKQLRFWLWGLAVWAYPREGPRRLHGQQAVTMPDERLATGAPWWARTRMFMVGAFFLLTALPLGFGLAIVQRVFNLKTPDLLKTITNYVSGVKLFNQPSRWGPGFTPWPAKEDFLDTLDEPPRVSVRRRMIRAIAAAASQRYDAWYVVAHSQGTVAAFNGLMETPYAWPGYFDEADWLAFRAQGFAGPATTPQLPGDTMPRRPVWAAPDEIAYRAAIFDRFRGFLTLGSPLEKFATIWPARVPICRIPAFRPRTVWINVFDPIDPVSGVLNAFDVADHAMCPSPINIGYRAGWILLLAHLQYLTRSGSGTLSEAVGNWLLSGDATFVTELKPRFAPGSATALLRGMAAFAWWLLVFAIADLAAGPTLRWVARRAYESYRTASQDAAKHGLALGWVDTAADSLRAALSGHGLAWWMVAALVFSVIGALVAGSLSRIGLTGRTDPAIPPRKPTPIPDLQPGALPLRPWP